MTVLVVTANVGGRDAPHPAVPQTGGHQVEWRYFTDGDLKLVPEPWKAERAVVGAGEHPNMAAKWYKTHPSGAHDATIWVDASMEITSPLFVAEAVSALKTSGAPVAACAHPRRDCVYAEAAASLGPEGLDRYDSGQITRQAAAYAQEGYPKHAGLWACGILAWAGTEDARLLGEAWWRECLEYGYQDQLSFPVVAWRLTMRPGTFPVPLIERSRRAGGLANRWLTIHPHTPGTDRPAVSPVAPEA